MIQTTVRFKNLINMLKIYDSELNAIGILDQSTRR